MELNYFENVLKEWFELGHNTIMDIIEHKRRACHLEYKILGCMLECMFTVT